MQDDYPNDQTTLTIVSRCRVGRLFNDVMDQLGQWRNERRPVGDRGNDQARWERDADWALDVFASSADAVLPEPRSTTLRQIMQHYCQTAEQRKDFCETFQALPTVIWIQKFDEGYGVVDALQLIPEWSFPEKELDCEIPVNGVICVCCYRPAEAKRLAAWFELYQCIHHGKCESVLVISERDFDLPDADELELGRLQEEYAEREHDVVEAERVLEELSSRQLELGDEEPYSRADFIAPSLDWAVGQDRAGRQMIEEYDRQYSKWMIYQGGWEAIERSRKELEQLNQKIEELRRRCGAPPLDRRM
ncbi:MAG: hypothetical protein KDB23_05545 [Planctomycetales bacterium]|nr:hypothetical protein [Planctomycetales bacterium]